MRSAQSKHPFDEARKKKKKSRCFLTAASAFFVVVFGHQFLVVAESSNGLVTDLANG